MGSITMNHELSTMSKKLETTWHLFLYLGLTVGSVAAYFSRVDSTRQFWMLLFMVAFYLIWGFAYHYSKKDASKKLFMEYTAIALIALGAGYLVLMS